MNTQCANRFLPPRQCVRVHWWAWPLWTLVHGLNNALSFRFLPGINKTAAAPPRLFRRILLHKCSSVWTRGIFMILFSLLFLLFNFQENYFSTLWKWQGFHCMTVTLQLLFSFITFKNGKWTPFFPFSFFYFRTLLGYSEHFIGHTLKSPWIHIIFFVFLDKAWAFLNKRLSGNENNGLLEIVCPEVQKKKLMA